VKSLSNIKTNIQNVMSNTNLFKTLLEIISAFLIIDYAGHVGIIADTLLNNYIDWYPGILHTIATLLVGVIYMQYIQPGFKDCLSIHGFWKGILLMLPFIPLAICRVMNFSELSLSASTIIQLAAYAITEEVKYRVLICSCGMKYATKPYQTILLIVFAGVFFGLNHFDNVLFGQSASYTLLQVVIACGIGILLAAIYIKTASFWATSLFHFLHNYISVSLGNGNLKVETAELSWSLSDVISIALLILVCVLYILVLFNKRISATNS